MVKENFFNVVFLGRRFDQKTVAVLDPLDGHQVLNCKCRGYKNNRKPISVQFKSLLLLGSCPCCIPATLYPHPPLPHHHPFSLNSWLMLKWENAFRVKINKEQISKKASTANQQMMLERLLERPWLQNLALSSWGTSFVDPQFTHLVRMDRMICTHRLNEIMYVKEFNESGDWRRGT